jgi:hypothetical protein
MSEIAETNEKSKESIPESRFWRGVWFPLLIGFFSPILQRYFSLPTTLIIISTIASFLSYFTPPKPKINFVKFFLIMQAVMLAAAFGIWLLPQQLEKAMPVFWAYFLPALLLFNAAYFVPPLDGRKREAHWKWILTSFLLALFYALAICYA